MLPEWSTACLDWEERILSGKSLIPFAPLFPEEAQLGLDTFKSLQIKDIPDHPSFGEIGRQWVFDFVSAIFGAYDAEEGKRYINEFFLCVPKKNSKSTLAAGIMLSALILNWREANDLLILAPTVEVASNSFDPAMHMVALNEDLSALMHTQEHYRKVTHRETSARLKVIAAEKESVGGVKAGFVLADELWLFGKKQNAENMFREATGGLASRPEGFKIWLTTQSDEPPSGLFKKKLDYARGVRDGEIDDPTFLPVIYEYPQSFINDKKHLDKKYWHIVNPNFNASVGEDFLIKEFKQAEIDGKDSMQGFLAKHLNIQMGLSLKHMNWAGADFWEAAAGKVTLDLLFERCEVLEIGIDGGGLDDLLGLVVVGRESVTQNWLLWARAWAHPIALERRKSEAPKYRDLEKAGDLVIVDAIGHDLKDVGDIVRRCDATGLLDRIGVDPAGIGAIVDEIEQGDAGGSGKIEHDRIVGIPQGWRLSGAIKTTERKVAEKTLIHGGQALMNWCVGNARCEVKGNNLYITKQASGTGKIDPLMAAFNAVALLAMNPEARATKSFWEKG